MQHVSEYRNRGGHILVVGELERRVANAAPAAHEEHTNGAQCRHGKAIVSSTAHKSRHGTRSGGFSDGVFQRTYKLWFTLQRRRLVLWMAPSVNMLDTGLTRSAESAPSAQSCN